MNVTTEQTVLKHGNSAEQATAGNRGERLYPARSSRLYWHLTQLRKAFESIVSELRDADCEIEKLVDYGCGNMPYRRLFSRSVHHYVGCDFECNELADVHLNPKGEIPLPPDFADIVLSSQVLEHVSSPSQYLDEARRILRPHGLLVLSTHGKWRYHPDPQDLWRWTCQGLRQQLEAAGFRIEHFRGVMGPGSTALQLWQDAVLFRIPRILQKPFTYCMQLLIQWADQCSCEPARDADACVYFVVARKVAETV